MTARALPLYVLATALTVALAVLAACGGGGDGEQPTGRLTDPRSVATATPWAEPPEPIILEPGALTPISDGGDGGDGGGTPTASGECGDTYKVESGDVPFTIAEKCGVTVEDLLKANPEVTPTALRVGQELKIP